MQVAIPRPASTVALLRDGVDGVDVWLMRRSSRMAFAAGMQAFPGGAVEIVDHDPLAWTGRPAAEVADVLGLDEPTARALLSAAVRETFEECGALLTRGAPADAESARLALLDDHATWSSLLASAGLSIDVDALVPWSRWITPDFSPIRFDAYFFVAALPVGREPRWIDGEAEAATWSPARAAVVAHERGELPMLPPTIETLRSIAKHATVADVLASAPARIGPESG